MTTGMHHSSLLCGSIYFELLFYGNKQANEKSQASDWSAAFSCQLFLIKHFADWYIYYVPWMLWIKQDLENTEYICWVEGGICRAVSGQDVSKISPAHNLQQNKLGQRIGRKGQQRWTFQSLSLGRVLSWISAAPLSVCNGLTLTKSCRAGVSFSNQGWILHLCSFSMEAHWTIPSSVTVHYTAVVPLYRLSNNDVRSCFLNGTKVKLKHKTDSMFMDINRHYAPCIVEV